MMHFWLLNAVSQRIRISMGYVPTNVLAALTVKMNLNNLLSISNALLIKIAGMKETLLFMIRKSELLKSKEFHQEEFAFLISMNTQKALRII